LSPLVKIIVQYNVKDSIGNDPTVTPEG